MAQKLSKAGIITGQDILAKHVTQSIDALTGTEAYNLTISGSLNLTGSAVTGSISNATSASYAITSSYALNGGGGGSVGTLQQVMTSGSSTTIAITSSIISASEGFIGEYFTADTPGSGVNRIAIGVTNRIDINPNNTVAVRLSDSLVTLNKDTSINGEITAVTNITSSGNISASGIVSMTTASVGGGLFTSASLAAGGGGGTTVVGNPGGNGANLTTISIGGTTFEVSGSSSGGTTFPFTGSAIISGSLKTQGVVGSNLDGQIDLTSSISCSNSPKTSNHRYFGQGSSQGYYLNGLESPYINFYPGKSYKFITSSASHPLRFYLDANKTTEYTTGVTGTGNAIQISVTEDTPSILYYQCLAHPLMGNAAYLQGGGNDYNNIQTHTVNFTSSATYNGKYNIVGGNLAIAVDTSSADLTTGMEWDFFQSSSGDTFEFVPKTGVTLISKNNHKKLAAQGSAASLKYISGQTFHLVGDLTL